LGSAGLAGSASAEQRADEKRLVQQWAHDVCRVQLMPRVLEASRHECLDPTTIPERSTLGLLGRSMPGTYDGAGGGYVSPGLVAREVERDDSGYRSRMSVQPSPRIQRIYGYGDEAQRQNDLPALASGRLIGRCGLTAPDLGADAGGWLGNSGSPLRLRALPATPVRPRRCSC
jgi:glutaryl-CoA dehydrogenase